MRPPCVRRNPPPRSLALARGLVPVVFGDVDYPVDCPVKFDFSKTAILFDKATGKNIACGTLELK